MLTEQQNASVAQATNQKQNQQKHQALHQASLLNKAEFWGEAAKTLGGLSRRKRCSMNRRHRFIIGSPMVR